MDGIHDLGGKHGFGPIDTREEGPAFTERWHAGVFTIQRGLFFSGVARNADHFRHAIERIDPVSYLVDGYYGRWLGGVETLLAEAGQLDQKELTARAAALGAPAEARIAARPSAAPDQFAPPPAAGAKQQPRVRNSRRETSSAPRFAIGQLVRTAAKPVDGHTRLPAYARGAVGEVVAHHGAWVYPDTNAHGRGEQPQHLYTVAFCGDVLWGSAGDADLEVCLDLFEPYLAAE